MNPVGSVDSDSDTCQEVVILNDDFISMLSVIWDEEVVTQVSVETIKGTVVKFGEVDEETESKGSYEFVDFRRLIGLYGIY